MEFFDVLNMVVENRRFDIEKKIWSRRIFVFYYDLKVMNYVDVFKIVVIGV